MLCTKLDLNLGLSSIDVLRTFFLFFLHVIRESNPLLYKTKATLDLSDLHKILNTTEDMKKRKVYYRLSGSSSFPINIFLCHTTCTCDHEHFDFHLINKNSTQLLHSVGSREKYITFSKSGISSFCSFFFFPFFFFTTFSSSSTFFSFSSSI